MSTSEKIQIGSLTTECYTRIKDDILNKRIPWGQKLNVPELTARFGISRSPVVKAIERLSHEGLVQIIPNRGSFVSAPTKRDIVEIAQVRIAFESMACELAFRRDKSALLNSQERNEAQISACERKQQRIPEDVWFTYDRDFHRIFAEVADNSRLLEIYEQVRNQIELFRVFYGEGDALRALELHREILTLLRQDRLGDALQVLRLHIEEVCEQTIDEFQRAVSEMDQ
ncbi:MAG: GntR family transcriptional regulator [Chloroflexi bacterium]|nr:GntR family transcriptional regulator [Chloroflexota bacterium]